MRCYHRITEVSMMDCEELEGDDIRKTMQSYADAAELMATSLNDRLERMKVEGKASTYIDEMADEEDDDDDDDDETNHCEQDVVREEENALLEFDSALRQAWIVHMHIGNLDAKIPRMYQRLHEACLSVLELIEQQDSSREMHMDVNTLPQFNDTTEMLQQALDAQSQSTIQIRVLETRLYKMEQDLHRKSNLANALAEQVAVLEHTVDILKTGYHNELIGRLEVLEHAILQIT